MPPSLIGFDTGTIEIKGVTVNFKDQSLLENSEIRLATSGGYSRISRIRKGLSVKDDDSDDEQKASEQVNIHLPIMTRYHSALVLKARNKGLFHRNTVAVGTIWLRDLVDNHTGGVVKATLWKGVDSQELKENYSKPEENVVGNAGEAVGEVELNVVFKPGVADLHEKEMQEDAEMRRVWEEYTIMKREGLRKNIGRKDIFVQLAGTQKIGNNDVSIAAEPGV